MKAPVSPRTGRSVGIAVAMLVALPLVVFGVDSLAYPWAFPWMRPITGTPALVGEWYGELTTATGRRQWIALELHAYLGRCGVRNCSRIQAGARVCDTHGLRDYEGGGHAQNWRGTQFDLQLLAKDDRQEGLRVIELQAERDSDALHAVARFGSGLSTAIVAVAEWGSVARAAVDPDTLFPVHLLLRRSSDRGFEQACRRLSGIR